MSRFLTKIFYYRHIQATRRLEVINTKSLFLSSINLMASLCLKWFYANIKKRNLDFTESKYIYPL